MKLLFLLLPFFCQGQTFRSDFLSEQKPMFERAYEMTKSDTLPNGLFLNGTTTATGRYYTDQKAKTDTCEVWALIIADTLAGYSETKRVFMETTGDKAADLEIKPPPENKRYWYIDGEYVRDGHDMIPSEWTYRWKSSGEQVFIDPKLVLMTFKK